MRLLCGFNRFCSFCSRLLEVIYVDRVDHCLGEESVVHLVHEVLGGTTADVRVQVV